MGFSGVIKVDTEQLRAMAIGYTIRSNSVDVVKNNNAGTIQTIIYRMPAYDGRLQQAAKADILDFNKRADEFSNWFKEDSASLIKTAEAFEVIDGQTIQIFQDADEITRASLVDAGKNLGLSTSITTQVVKNIDGSVSTITVVRTINDDGTVTTTTYLHTVLTLSVDTAKEWNETDADVKAFFSWGIGLATLPLAPVYGGIITTGAFIEQIYENHNPPRGWQAGDTITMDSTIVTTEPLETPNTPIPEAPVLGPDITTTTVVTDSSGTVLSEDTTGIGPTGILK